MVNHSYEKCPRCSTPNKVPACGENCIIVCCGCNRRMRWIFPIFQQSDSGYLLTDIEEEE